MVDHFYRYPNHPYLCHYHTPAYDTYLLLQSHNLLQAQILDKEAITNKDQNDSDEDILKMEERTKGRDGTRVIEEMEVKHNRDKRDGKEKGTTLEQSNRDGLRDDKCPDDKCPSINYQGDNCPG